MRQVEISVDGELYGRYDLNEDQEIRSIRRIKCRFRGNCEDDVGRVSGSDLRSSQRDSRTGESIICLPNKIVVSIIGGDATDGGISPDAVSN